MNKYGFVFAGQGAQFVGMGKSLYDLYPEVRSLYSKASSILGYDLANICFYEKDLLDQTKYAQPAIMVTSYCLYQVLIKETLIMPEIITGFSLGEYTALLASGAISFSQAVELLERRAHFMMESSKKNKGAMAAIIVYPRISLDKLCQEVGDVSIANYNCPTQLVISGKYSSVLKVCELAKQDGARRTVLLNVSGAFHTEFMMDAAKNMKNYIKDYNFSLPKIRIIMNCDRSLLEERDLKELLVKQIVSPVYFEDSIKDMINIYGVNTFVEIGPGNVLSGFIKKIDSSKEVISINSITDIQNIK